MRPITSARIKKFPSLVIDRNELQNGSLEVAADREVGYLGASLNKISPTTPHTVQ